MLTKKVLLNVISNVGRNFVYSMIGLFSLLTRGWAESCIEYTLRRHFLSLTQQTLGPLASVQLVAESVRAFKLIFPRAIPFDNFLFFYV